MVTWDEGPLSFQAVSDLARHLRPFEEFHLFDDYYLGIAEPY
jgi:hypothetical protein